MIITKAAAAVSLDAMNFIYDGNAKTATVSTTPSGLNVTVTYNGTTTAPTAAGSYAVAAIVDDPNYQGGATGTLNIGNITSQVSVKTSGFVYSRASKTYNGTLTVTNSGQSVIYGTVIVQLNDLTAGVTVVNQARISNGAPQIDKDLAAPLNPGQSVSFPIQLNDPTNVRISFNPSAFMK
jgi:hypothetical protein